MSNGVHRSTAPATAADIFDAICATPSGDEDEDSVRGGGGEPGGITGQLMERFASSVKRELTEGSHDGDCVATVSVEEMVVAARSGRHVVVDVRSPGEFSKGHVPGAVNLPLFTDAERAKVGTAFAKQGRAPAMVLGMRCVLPKLAGIVETVEKLAAGRTEEAKGRASEEEAVKVYVHCWRGGMRSSSVTWLLRHRCAGLNVHCVAGGYKMFRRWALTRWSTVVTGTKPGGETTAAEAAEEEAAVAGGAATVAEHAVPDTLPAPPHGPRVCIIGGRTGVGKTRVLLALRTAGEQVIDLEVRQTRVCHARLIRWIKRTRRLAANCRQSHPLHRPFDTSLFLCQSRALDPGSASLLKGSRGA